MAPVTGSKRKPSPVYMDEGHGWWKELGAPPKNPPVYGKLHADTVWYETGETLPGTGDRKRKAYKPKGEVAQPPEGSQRGS